jgi:hypothetical protein
MGIDDSFRQGKFNKAIPAIELINTDFPDILALAIWTF